METIKYELSGPKEVYEVGVCVQRILEKTAEQLKDGWQPGEDVPPIVAAALGSLISAIEGVQKLPEAFAGDPILASMAAINPMLLGVRSLIEK